MIFSDERNIWNSEQEDLAELLANKNQDEIFDILDGYKSLLVKVGEPRYTTAQRLIQLLTIPLIPCLFLLMGVKYIITGDKYLDSWLCKIGMNSERTHKYFL